LTRSIPRLEMRFPCPHASSQDQGHGDNALLLLVGHHTRARAAPLRHARRRRAALRLCTGVRWARPTPRARVPARKREGTNEGQPVEKHGTTSGARHRDATASHANANELRRGEAVALGAGVHTAMARVWKPSLHETFVARRPEHRCPRHNARSALSTAAHRGVILGLKQALKDSALTCWGARRPPPGWRRGEPAGKRDTKAEHGLSRRRALGSGLDTMVDPHSAGVRSLQHRRQSWQRKTTPLTAGRRWSRRRLGAEDTSRRGRGSRR
jgi:hypothetical protein